MTAGAAQVIAVFGLLLGFVAGIMMYYFPPRLIRYTDKGEGEITWVRNPTDDGKRKGRSQLFFSKAAPWLLAVAFLLQLPAVLQPLLEAKTPDIADSVVDCSFLDVGLNNIPTQAILRISFKTQTVLNLSFIPPRPGTATISESSYVLEFTDVPVLKERFTINRRTGVGWRELINNSGEIGPRDRSALTCRPYQGKPL